MDSSGTSFFALHSPIVHLSFVCRSVYTPCPSGTDEDPGLDFLKPTSSVRYVIADDPASGKYMRVRC